MKEGSGDSSTTAINRGVVRLRLHGTDNNANGNNAHGNNDHGNTNNGNTNDGNTNDGNTNDGNTNNAHANALDKKNLNPFDNNKHHLLIHAQPVHTSIHPSLFSKESHAQNYRGFINLALLLLFANLVRLAVENWTRYGLLLTIPFFNLAGSDWAYAAITMSLLTGSLGFAWLTELYAVMAGSVEPVVGAMVGLNLATLFLIPPYIIWTRVYHPGLGMLALGIALVLSMKLISYHAVNYELRQLFRRSNTPLTTTPTTHESTEYPFNVSLPNLVYFWWAPTLCYQPSYPRIPRIRWGFLGKRLLEFASASAMIYILLEQYATPTVRNSLKPMAEGDWLMILERMLKLSASSLGIWLLGFYALFHSFLNGFAEVLCFGDRSFYLAWWNASTIEEYWRWWNTPVHAWLKRHIYTPLRARGYSRGTAQAVIFGLSAFFHEYLVAIPMHLLRGWAFGAMLVQVPLIALTKAWMRRYPQSSMGNFFFWITLCILGQPMLVMLYFRSWAAMNP